MRTVSFSPADIKSSLAKNFVCHMINTEGEPGSGASQAHAPNDKPGECADGVANQNVQLLFLTPQGEIFHTTSGFRGPKSLQQELIFSKALFDQIKQKPDSAKSIVRTMHQQRLANPPVAQNSSRTRRSRSRSGRGGGGGIRQSLQFDFTFAQTYPMLPMTRFEENPRLLVGSGTSVFVSGSSAGGRIGG